MLSTFHFAPIRPGYARVGDYRLGLVWVSVCACAVVANTQAVIHQIKYGRPSVAQMDL